MEINHPTLDDSATEEFDQIGNVEARTRALRLIVVHRGQLEFQIKLLAVALVPLAQSARAQPEDNLADFFIIQRR